MPNRHNQTDASAEHILHQRAATMDDIGSLIGNQIRAGMRGPVDTTLPDK